MVTPEVYIYFFIICADFENTPLSQAKGIISRAEEEGGVGKGPDGAEGKGAGHLAGDRRVERVHREEDRAARGSLGEG